MTYEIEFTELAKAFGTARCGSVEALEKIVRAELDELNTDPLKIFFHTVLVGETWDTGQAFICMAKDGKMLVDSATYEEGEELKEGPFKGKRPMMPRGDSDR